ncbi:hypothetical protein AKJ48_03185 [candidate division MSBL1 archaeon SCGC-AAA261O19]|uniref:DOD-type homing endonuclease domain-containing protein n=1 Tax=candidate division MSBL1 archaeon SCGC-AAA261O19 TaxID=1698277 RepID=A0A133VCY6_9EURY|nr:hypothetical protein AKJ48_03185 [candidate division MSBL1 archaeon SCGC-AAA261O19]
MNPILERVPALQNIRGEPIIAVTNGRKHNFRDIPTKHVKETFEKASYFYVARSPHKVRLPEYPEPKLLHLVGYHAGDGHLEDVEKTVQRRGRGHYEISYSDCCGEMLHKVLGPAFEKLFNISLRLSKRPREKTYIGRVESKVIHTFLNRVIGLPTGSTKPVVPKWIRRGNKDLTTHFLRGFFDAEGSIFSDSYDGTVRISTSSSSLTILKQIYLMLQKCGISFCKPYMKHKQQALEIKTGRSVTIQRFAKRIGFTHPAKAAKLENMLDSARA